MHDSLPATRQSLLDLLADEEVFNVEAYLDAQDLRVVFVARDLIDYCRGDVEGTDLQLSDSKDLPVAQAIAEEELAREHGHDEDGLPFGAEDARYHRLPRPGPGADAALALDDWIASLNITLPPGGATP